MKRLLLLLTIAVFIFSLSACGDNTNPEESANPSATTENITASSEIEPSQMNSSDNIEIQITAGDTVITAELADSKTTQDFLKLLPLTLDMTRFYDREYAASLPCTLSEEGEPIDDYTNGDFCYWPQGNAFAIFFDKDDTFSQDGLIRLGKITSSLTDLAEFGDTVQMTIERITEADPMTNAKAEVEAAYRARCEAMVNKDIDALNKMMDYNLILRHITGVTQTKEEWLACIENEEMRYYNIDISNLNVTVNGDKASVDHTATLDARIYGGRGSWTLSGTSYFKKVNGEWIWTNPPEDK